jgi:hypothetical protein
MLYILPSLFDHEFKHRLPRTDAKLFVALGLVSLSKYCVENK